MESLLSAFFPLLLLPRCFSLAEQTNLPLWRFFVVIHCYLNKTSLRHFLSFEKNKKKRFYFLVKWRFVTKIWQKYMKSIISKMINVILLVNIPLNSKMTRTKKDNFFWDLGKKNISFVLIIIAIISLTSNGMDKNRINWCRNKLQGGTNFTFFFFCFFTAKLF